MTAYDFDTVINRRGTDSAKWDSFDADVVALHIADMDFPSPEPVVQALKARIDHRIFGYTFDSSELRAVLCERMQRLYAWTVTPEQIVFLPRVITGLSVTCRMFGQPGSGVLIQPPTYMPFLSIPGDNGQTPQAAELAYVRNGSRLRYEIDFDAFEQAIDARTKIFMLCSPHNPVGRVWTRDELSRLAEICLRHDLLICSDEIHCDLLMDGRRHLPIAALSPEIAARTVTLMAPTKTFNIPGLGFAFAIIQNEDLRKRYVKGLDSLTSHPSMPGLVAALAAYRDGQEWLEQALAYMQANRDYALDAIDECLPGVYAVRPEATYLLWLDPRAVVPVEEAAPANGFAAWMDSFFLTHAKVALNRGATFGKGGEGFVRLNLASPRSVLADALQRMRAALEQAGRRANP